MHEGGTAWHPCYARSSARESQSKYLLANVDAKGPHKDMSVHCNQTICDEILTNVGAHERHFLIMS